MGSMQDEQAEALRVAREWLTQATPIALTERDYFAMAALGHLAADRSVTPYSAARRAYEIADAMMAERAKETP